MGLTHGDERIRVLEKCSPGLRRELFVMHPHDRFNFPQADQSFIREKIRTGNDYPVEVESLPPFTGPDYLDIDPGRGLPDHGRIRHFRPADTARQ
jgi:hypothetical protein